MKNIININESQLKNIIKKSIQEVTGKKYREVEDHYREIWEDLMYSVNLKDLSNAMIKMNDNIRFGEAKNDPRYKKAYECVCTLVNILNHVKSNFDTAHSHTDSWGFGSEYDEDAFYDDPANDDKDADDMDVATLRRKYPVKY